jgi:hypothetical protein
MAREHNWGIDHQEAIGFCRTQNVGTRHEQMILRDSGYGIVRCRIPCVGSAAVDAAQKQWAQ